MPGWMVFRILGDLSHLLAKCILVVSIHRNRSAEGVSLITQMLYAIVFCTRYTDVFHERSWWNYIFKIVYILSSFYTIAVMQWWFPRTREREFAWKLGAMVLTGSLVLSPFVMLIFDYPYYAFSTWIWDFSEVLESVCVLPQLLLLRQTSVPTVITSFYLLTLGSYRGFYLLNWIWRGLSPHTGAGAVGPPNAVSVVFGVIQTALYLDFAWVYWTRQRVKLRSGGVVDADDLRKGWLLRRIFSHRSLDVGHDDDDAADNDAVERGAAGRGPAQRRSAGSRAKWGARGISVSADDGTLEEERRLRDDEDLDEDGDDDGVGGLVDPDARMRDPEELARALVDDEDDDEDDENDLPLPPAHTDAQGKPSGVGGGHEWRT